jgi:hypothetical protein
MGQGNRIKIAASLRQHEYIMENGIHRKNGDWLKRSEVRAEMRLYLYCLARKKKVLKSQGVSQSIGLNHELLLANDISLSQPLPPSSGDCDVVAGLSTT